VKEKNNKARKRNEKREVMKHNLSLKKRKHKNRKRRKEKYK